MTPFTYPPTADGAKGDAAESRVSHLASWIEWVNRARDLAPQPIHLTRRSCYVSAASRA
jgi:hypothetical protein